MITNAQTSGITIDRNELKALMRRSDRPGLICLGCWLALLVVTGTLVLLSAGTWFIIPALLLYSGIFAIPAYALSHECAHGTAFRTRWLNEAVFWFTSLLYFEEPMHRRYSHASHHSHTWIEGRRQPDASCFHSAQLRGPGRGNTGARALLAPDQDALAALSRRFSDDVRRVTPPSELPRMRRNTQVCVAIYLGGTAISIAAGWMWPVWLIVLPRLFGGPIMNSFILIQHVEMAENQPNILQSTRSFRTNPFFRFLYFNMNHHIEHHLYPAVPFHALPELGDILKEQLPEPDAGFLSTHREVLRIMICRSLGMDDRSTRIRQAFSYDVAGAANDGPMA